MDPITIAGLTIGLPQLISWGISIGSIIISNVHTWINERKRKKRDAARLLALQDQVTSTIETKLDAAAKELGQGAEKAAELQKAIQQSNDTLAREQLEKEMQALWKQQKEKEAQINSLMARLESRDQALNEQQEQARQAQEKWLQAVKHMEHVTMPLEQLLGQRRAMRAKLLPLADMQPGCKPDDWHITTIVGPAGKGKSSFVRELLELHNYPNKLCEEVHVSAAGAGTLETMTYMLPKHNVLLLDCVGNAAAGHLARSEVIAADTVLIFMSDDARAEELHGDAFALAWRLRDYMHTVFVQPKADLWLQHNRSDQSPDDAIGALRYAVLAELRSKLSYSATQAQPGLRDRLAECQLSPAPEVAALLHLVDTMSMRAWVRATASDFWISVHCYYCMTNYVTGMPNQVTRIGVRDQAAEQALSVEAQAVRKAAMGALGSGGMPLSLLLRDSRLNSSSQFQEGPVLHANSSEAMALVLRDSVSKYIGQLLFGRSCFYECRLLQLQWWRPANCLRLYVDIRGEADLRPPLGSSIAVIKLRPSHAELVVGAPGSWEWSNVDALGTCLLAHTPDAWEACVQKPGHFKGVLVWQAAKANQVLEKLLLFQLADDQGMSCYANREGAAAGRHALVFCYANNLEQTKLSNYTLAPVAIASPLPYRTGRSKEAELAVAWKALPGARTQQQGAFDKELAAEDEVQEKLRWVGLPKAVVARGRGWWV